MYFMCVCVCFRARFMHSLLMCFFFCREADEQQGNFRWLKTAWPSKSQKAVRFTFCTTLELLRHRWMGVLRPSQIHRHKIPSFTVQFRRFTTPRQKNSEKAPCVRKPLTPFWDWGRTPPPWFEFLVVFDFFAPWYRKSWEASSVKIL